MRRKKGCSCINLENGVDAWNRKTRAHASLFGCEAGGRPNRRQRRGARRRRNKGLRGVRHHVRYAGGALSSEDVVLDDERTRACGRRSTTSGTLAAPWAPKTWCSTTKEQGFAGSGAPRPVRRRRLGPQRRGARRRRNKVLRRVKHHVPRRQGASPRGPRPTKKGPTHSRSS